MLRICHSTWQAAQLPIYNLPRLPSLRNIWMRSFTTSFESETISSLEKRLKMAQTASKEPSVLKGRLLEFMGLIYRKEGDVLASQSCFGNALQNYRAALGETNDLVSDMRKELAINVFQTGQKDLAFWYLAERSSSPPSARNTTPPPEETLLGKEANVFREDAIAQCKEGKIQEAIASFEKELLEGEEFEKTASIPIKDLLEFWHCDHEEQLNRIIHIDARDSGISKTYNILGFCHQMLGKEKKATYYFRKSLEAWTRRVTERKPATFPLNFEGFHRYFTPPALERFHDISWRFHGEVDPIAVIKHLEKYRSDLFQNPDHYTPIILFRLGKSLSRYQEHYLAISYFEQALAIHKQLWGGKEGPLVDDIQKELKEARGSLLSNIPKE